MNSHKPLLLCLALLPALSAQAQEDRRFQDLLLLPLEELMELEVTISTATRQALRKAPAVVTVITREDLKATGATNLVDALESVPGIHIRANQFAFRPLVQFRGANASQTLLMVNGAPVKDLMWGFGIFWKGLPTSMIERVEIIRGPGSALFGADAMAGVINVITKTAGTIEHNEMGARIGGFDSRGGWLQYGDRWNGIDIGLTAELSTTDGHDPFFAADGQSRQDAALGTAASLAPATAGYGWRNTDLRLSLAKGDWRLLADYTAHDDLESGVSGAGVLDPLTRAEDSRLNLALLYNNERFSDQWGVDATLRYQHLDYDSGEGFQENPPGAFGGGYPDGVINRMASAERRLDAELSALYSGFDDHTLRIGAGYTWQDLYRVEQWINHGTGPDGTTLPVGAPLTDLSDTPYAFAPEKTRRTWHLFAQDVWSLNEQWELTAGARYDHYSDFGDTLNPRLALVWQTSDRLTTKLMYGEAFRAPSFQQLFTETSFTLPNPNLGPERSNTWDLSLAWAVSEDLHLGASLYHFEQSDFIRARTVAGLAKRQYQNGGEHTIKGVELEARWQAGDDLRLSANLSHRDQQGDEFRAVQEADHEGYLRADWRLHPDWNWNLQANWIGERERRAGDARPALDDHLVVDTTVRYTGLKQWEFAASIRNLFDEEARDYTGAALPDDLPLPGRSLYAEVRYLF